MTSSRAISLLAGVLFSTGAAWLFGGCNCGGFILPDGGTSCVLPSDCRSNETCVDNVCVLGDGGSNPGQDGGTNDGGTNDGGTNDGGTRDGGGGGCQGLQCQQQACPDGGTTTLTGAIYDPSGQVPLYNATVYVPNAALAPFTPGVNCDRCGASISGQPIAIAITGSDGRFTLRNVPAGTDIPLVMQMGRWRRKVVIPSVPACQSMPLTDAGLLHMPRSRAEGDLPQMAIATGSADPFQCLLEKMGIALSEFTRPDAPDAGRVHFYRQNGMDLSGGAPAGAALYSDAGTLARYDVVILPCEGRENRKDAGYTQNLINYANMGGRAFITHYGYVWTAFAQQPFPSTATWNPRSVNQAPPNPYEFTLDRSFPKGQAFGDWLANVGASDGGSLSVEDPRHDVDAVNTAVATRWVYATSNPTNGAPIVQHLTFNTPVNPPPLPDGDAGVQCGRVLFSDFHVSAGAANGNTFPNGCVAGPFSAQEKALVFMLFDLSACVQDDSTAPSTCGAINDGCLLTSQCCSGLTCQDSSGLACTGAGCSCQVTFN